MFAYRKVKPAKPRELENRAPQETAEKRVMNVQPLVGMSYSATLFVSLPREPWESEIVE